MVASRQILDRNQRESNNNSNQDTERSLQRDQGESNLLSTLESWRSKSKSLERKEKVIEVFKEILSNRDAQQKTVDVLDLISEVVFYSFDYSMELSGLLSANRLYRLLKEVLQLENIEEEKMANMMWGLGKLAQAKILKKNNINMLDSLIKEFLRKLKDARSLNSKNIANIICGLGKLAEAGLLEKVEMNALTTSILALLDLLRGMSKVDSQHIANTVWGLGRLAEAGLLEKVEANALIAFIQALPVKLNAKQDIKHDTKQDTKQDAYSQEIANTVWGLGRLAEAGLLQKVDANALMPSILGLLVLLHAMPKVKSQEVANTVWGLGKLAEAGLLQKVDANTLTPSVQGLLVKLCEISNVDSQAIANTLWGLGRLAEAGLFNTNNEVNLAIMRLIESNGHLIDKINVGMLSYGLYLLGFYSKNLKFISDGAVLFILPNLTNADQLSQEDVSRFFQYFSYVLTNEKLNLDLKKKIKKFIDVNMHRVKPVSPKIQNSVFDELNTLFKYKKELTIKNEVCIDGMFFDIAIYKNKKLIFVIEVDGDSHDDVLQQKIDERKKETLKLLKPDVGFFRVSQKDKSAVDIAQEIFVKINASSGVVIEDNEKKTQTQTQTQTQTLEKTKMNVSAWERKPLVVSLRQDKSNTESNNNNANCLLRGVGNDNPLTISPIKVEEVLIKHDEVLSHKDFADEKEMAKIMVELECLADKGGFKKDDTQKLNEIIIKMITKMRSLQNLNPVITTKILASVGRLVEAGLLENAVTDMLPDLVLRILDLLSKVKDISQPTAMSGALVNLAKLVESKLLKNVNPDKLIDIIMVLFNSLISYRYINSQIVAFMFYFLGKLAESGLLNGAEKLTQLISGFLEFREIGLQELGRAVWGLSRLAEVGLLEVSVKNKLVDLIDLRLDLFNKMLREGKSSIGFEYIADISLGYATLVEFGFLQVNSKDRLNNFFSLLLSRPSEFQDFSVKLIAKILLGLGKLRQLGLLIDYCEVNALINKLVLLENYSGVEMRMLGYGLYLLGFNNKELNSNFYQVIDLMLKNSDKLSEEDLSCVYLYFSLLLKSGELNSNYRQQINKFVEDNMRQLESWLVEKKNNIYVGLEVRFKDKSELVLKRNITIDQKLYEAVLYKDGKPWLVIEMDGGNEEVKKGSSNPDIKFLSTSQFNKTESVVVNEIYMKIIEMDPDVVLASARENQIMMYDVNARAKIKKLLGRLSHIVINGYSGPQAREDVLTLFKDILNEDGIHPVDVLDVFYSLGNIIGEDNNELLPLLSTEKLNFLMSKILQLKEIKEKDVANMLWVLGKLIKAKILKRDINFVLLYDKVINKFIEQLKEIKTLTSKDIAKTLWGVGKLAKIGLLKKVEANALTYSVQALLVKLCEISNDDSQAIANAFWGLGKLAEAGLLKKAEVNELTPSIQGLLVSLCGMSNIASQAIANTVWGLGRLAEAGLLRKVDANALTPSIQGLLALLSGMPNVNSKDVTSTLSGLGKLAKAGLLNTKCLQFFSYALENKKLDPGFGGKIQTVTEYNALHVKPESPVIQNSVFDELNNQCKDKIELTIKNKECIDGMSFDIAIYKNKKLILVIVVDEVDCDDVLQQKIDKLKENALKLLNLDVGFLRFSQKNKSAVDIAKEICVKINASSDVVIEGNDKKVEAQAKTKWNVGAGEYKPSTASLSMFSGSGVGNNGVDVSVSPPVFKQT